MSITLNSYNLITAERSLCEQALTTAGNFVEAAKLLGITRHALKRRIIKHNIRWSRAGVVLSEADQPIPYKLAGGTPSAS